ncbi:copper amine oxidase N-terminal domain-containing protein [Neomoorella mulderi]|uniref:Copper amine oxidase-like N-terminal domain-containing protein n=1 Tax=Moorella mulderi DSM 14980 TaxID=1122241 RepID=A0A151AUA8_9FIRM|nr:copper amine oxidase N-terminal domain-containing protein [Moorella mulderi]KYH31130.1 hypothetical protein MOMUL_26630 [Moorella mulderi DSM 14980]
MKRAAIILYVIFIVLFGGIAVARAGENIRIFVDGKEIYTDVPLQVIEGRTMVPLRAVGEALGADVRWDDANNTVVIVNHIKELQLPSEFITLLEQNPGLRQVLIQWANLLRTEPALTNDFLQNPEMLPVLINLAKLINSDPVLANKLADTIEKHYNPTPPIIPQFPTTPLPKNIPSTSYKGLGSGHWISENSDGKYIKLEDGSLWEISSFDQIDTRFWLTTDDITVIENNNPFYPYLLINTDEAEEAEAKLLSQ